MKTHVDANWQRVLLVCGKCTRKLGGGFGKKGRTPIAKLLRKSLALGKGRKARVGVTEVKCLGICPRRAAVVIDSADLGRWHVIPAGTDENEVARLALGPIGMTTSAVISSHHAGQVVTRLRTH